MVAGILPTSRCSPARRLPPRPKIAEAPPALVRFDRAKLNHKVRRVGQPGQRRRRQIAASAPRRAARKKSAASFRTHLPASAQRRKDRCAATGPPEETTSLPVAVGRQDHSRGGSPPRSSSARPASCPARAPRLAAAEPNRHRPAAPRPRLPASRSPHIAASHASCSPAPRPPAPASCCRSAPRRAANSLDKLAQRLRTNRIAQCIGRTCRSAGPLPERNSGPRSGAANRHCLANGGGVGATLAEAGHRLHAGGTASCGN